MWQSLLQLTTRLPPNIIYLTLHIKKKSKATNDADKIEHTPHLVTAKLRTGHTDTQGSTGQTYLNRSGVVEKNILTDTCRLSVEGPPVVLHLQIFKIHSNPEEVKLKFDCKSVLNNKNGALVGRDSCKKAVM